jgi:hypothetical protein
MSNNNIYYDMTPDYPKEINKKMNKLYNIDLYDDLYNIPCYKDNCNGKFVYMMLCYTLVNIDNNNSSFCELVKGRF